MLPGTDPAMPSGQSSAAIDQLDSSAATTDQRGIARPQGTKYDIGAVEVEQVAITAAFLPTDGGSLVCSPAYVRPGVTSSCTASPATGYRTQSISGCGGTQTGVGSTLSPPTESPPTARSQPSLSG